MTTTTTAQSRCGVACFNGLRVDCACGWHRLIPKDMHDERKEVKHNYLLDAYNYHRQEKDRGKR